MDYRRLSTKRFVKSCQLQDNSYCSVLPSLTKPASGLVSTPLGVSVSALVGQQLQLRAAETTPLHPDLLTYGMKASVTAGISIRCWRQLKRSCSEVVGLVLTLPAGLKLEGTDPL